MGFVTALEPKNGAEVDHSFGKTETHIPLAESIEQNEILVL